MLYGIVAACVLVVQDTFGNYIKNQGTSLLHNVLPNLAGKIVTSKTSSLLEATSPMSDDDDDDDDVGLNVLICRTDILGTT